MRQQLKGVFLLSLFLLMPLQFLIPTTFGQGEVELIQQRIQYGHWEINPVINNVLTDWRVARSSGGVPFATWVTPSASDVNMLNYIIDPDGVQKSQYRFFQQRQAADTEPQQGVSAKTNIYSSSPAVGFSVGQVYLSDYNGNHWSRLGYQNFTDAGDKLTNLRTIINPIRNATYIYREVPYSVKVCFWTQGKATYTYAPGGAIELFKLTKEREWALGQWDTVSSYKMNWEYMNASWVDIDEVTAQLKMSIQAPLFTQQATRQIAAPDGSFTALYNDTWIGFIDAHVSKIDGGPIDTSLDLPAALEGVNRPINATAEGSSGDSKMNLGSGPTGDVYTPSGGAAQQVVTPTVSQVGETQNSGSPENIDAASSAGNPQTNSVDRGNLGFIGTSSLNSAQVGTYVAAAYGFPAPNNSRLLDARNPIINDPNTQQSYFLSSNYAVGAQIGSAANKYVIRFNQSPEFDPVSGTFTPTLSGNSNWINAEIRSQITEVNRQYSTDLALDRDIPNDLTFTLSATMQPGLHTWYKRINWDHKSFHQDWLLHFWEGGVSYAAPALKEQSTGVLKVINGQEVINVYMTYTITFTVVLIDRYNIKKAPATNVWATDQLDPWVKQQLHDDYYDEYYEYNVEFFGGQGYFGIIFWAVFGIIMVFHVIRAYNDGDRKAGKKSFYEALGKWKGILIKVVIAFIVGLVVQIAWNFLGGFLG